MADGRNKKNLRPMKNRFNSQKHSRQTKRTILYSRTGERDLFALRSKRHVISHLSTQHSTHIQWKCQKKLRVQIKQLNPLVKFMNEMTSFYYSSNRNGMKEANRAAVLLLLECVFKST